MEIGGKGKIVKPQKTKFKDRDGEYTNIQKQKNKKRDKNVLRLMRQEKEYVV
jgi:hypothetical protein